MIRHIVMFRLKADTDAAKAISGARARLSEFQKEIPSLRRLTVAVNAPDAPQSNCEIALICDFDDINGLEEYRVHPVHVAFGQYITPLRESRSCIDYELD